MKIRNLLLGVVMLGLVGCAGNPGQNRYNLAEAGKATEVEYATVMAVKKVDITGENTGAGAFAGG